MRSHASRASHATALPVGASDSARAASSPGAPGAAGLGLLDEAAVERLQAMAGNRAAGLAIAAGGVPPAAPVQRQPPFAPASPFADPSMMALRPGDAGHEAGSGQVDPGPLVLRPADIGKPAVAMTMEELGEAIDDHGAFINAQTRTSPEVLRRERRLAELVAARNALVTRARLAGTSQDPSRRRRGRERKGPKAMPQRPESLGRSVDLRTRTPKQIRDEYDRVVAYLAAGPAPDEREALELELPNLEQAIQGLREERISAARDERLARVLKPKPGPEADQFGDIMRRIQDAEHRPDEGGWLIHGDGEVLPMSDTEMQALRASVGKGLARGAKAVGGRIYDVESAWLERNDKARQHPVVHRLSRWTAGVDDITRREIEQMVQVGSFYNRRVAQAGREGRLTYAAEQLLVFDGIAEHWERRVGEWEQDLTSAARNWAIALTIVKEALSIWAGAKAVGMVSGAGGGFFGALKAGGKVAAVTTGTGAVTGYAGAAVVGADREKGARLGAGAGFGVGANALTAGIGRVASVADAAKATGAVRKTYVAGKALTLEALGNTATSMTQAGIEGGSMTDAAVTAGITSPISAGGGAVVEHLAAGSRKAIVAGKTGVGAVAGMTGALATGQDLQGTITATLTGAGGQAYGAYKATAPAAAPDAGTTGGGAPAPSAGEPTTSTGGGASAGESTGVATKPSAAAGGGGAAVSQSADGDLPTAADIDSHMASLDEAGVAAANPGGTKGYSIPVEAIGGKGRPAETAAGGTELAGAIASVPGAVADAAEVPELTVPRVGAEDATTPANSAPPVGALEATAPAPPVGALEATAPQGHRPGSAATAAPRPVSGADSTAPAPSQPETVPIDSTAKPPATRPEPPRGRPLVPSAQVPDQLTPTAKPAFDIEQLKANAGRAGYDPKRDLPAGGAVPSSTPSAAYAAEEPGRYVATGEKPVAGISKDEAYVVTDSRDGNRKLLFKPLDAEKPVGRAEERGIRAREQAPREVAAPMVAKELGMAAPEGRLATINGQEGVLVEWRETNSLRDLAIADPAGFKRLIASDEFRRAMTSLDALDYLVNNLDRATNFGNYLYEFTPDGLTLTPIDHGLTFTSTKERASIEAYTRDLPEEYPPDLARRLEDLDQNRATFIEKIRPFVGDAAVVGFVHRLDIMIKDMRAKRGAGP